MVQIELNFGSSISEYGLIELQGELESKKKGPNELTGTFIGDLHFSKEGDTPVLIIGHHILYGKCVELEKPLLIMKRQAEKYDVKAVIRKKLIFRNRPKPIVTI